MNFYRFRALALPLLFASIALLVLVFIPGIGAGYGTAKSWINFFGFSLQPSEVVKLTFLFYLASWFSAKGEHHLRDWRTGFLPFISLLMVIMVLMALQPDFGTMSIIVVMALAVYFVAGGRILYLTGLGALGAAGLWLMVKISPYRAARFTTFLHPELDPQGIGYHINQAFLAVGSGGWLGKGAGASQIKLMYLPVPHTDFIFPVIAEENGFFGSMVIVLLFLALLIKGVRVARNAPSFYTTLAALGLTLMITIQAFFNLSMATGLIPTKGIPLPFFSYGGSSILATLISVGIILNVSAHRNPVR